MGADLTQAWRRGAMALAIPATFLLLLALVCIGRATSRTLYDGRAAGVVTNLSYSKKQGWQPIVEYAVEGKTYRIQTASYYPETTFAVGQTVAVLYPPDRPPQGTVNSFRELWQTSVLLSIFGLLILGVAWKAKTGLPPILHALSGFGILMLGGLVGMTILSLLLFAGGLEICSGLPRLVSLVGGILIFFGTVPVAALGAFTLWQKHVPARCSHCAGGMRLEFAGKQMIYTCASCGYQPWRAPSQWYGRHERLPTA